MSKTPSETSPLIQGRSSSHSNTNSGNDGSVVVQIQPNTSSAHNNEARRGINWSRVYKIIKPYMIPKSWALRVLMAMSIVCVILSKLSKLLPPIALKWAVDDLAKNGIGPNSLSVPFLALGAYFLGRLGEGMFKSMQSLFFAVVQCEQRKLFAVDIFSHLVNLDVTYHVRRRTGEVNRIMDRGAESIETLSNTVMFTLAPTLLETALVFGIFLQLGTPLIAIVTLVSVALYVWFTKVVTEMRIHHRRAMTNADNAVKEKEVDSLINYETVKLFGRESFEVGLYQDLQEAFRDRYKTVLFSLQLLNFGQTFLQVLGASVSLVLAAYACARGLITPGDFVAINAFIANLFQPLAFLGTMYRIIVQASTDLEKCITLFEAKSVVQDHKGAIPLDISERDLIQKEKGGIVFDNVTFRYKTEDRSTGGVFNLNFEVKPGRMLGVVGSSGAGKSTLVRLLVRFYDVDSGRVLIDGVDVRKYTQESVRQTFGVVAQETSLFNRSLRYNIAYGNIEASDEEVYKAIEAAQLRDFTSRLPQQLETVVGERGVRLSGGEKQRVGVARCIVRSPIFVLLDEASSSLDSETEREMQEAIQEICRGRTTIAVAHRLSTVMMADEIIVLDSGRIVERGTHDELLQLNGKYYAMWLAQTEDQSTSSKRKSSTEFDALS